MASPSQIDLSGKNVFVTGGSKGMGFGIARAFLACKARVAICSNEPESLAQAQAELDAGSDLIAIEADVSLGNSVKRAVAQTVGQFGGLNVLVNSAGIQRYGTITDTPEETWDEVMSVNLKGIYWASRYAIPHIEGSCPGAWCKSVALYAAPGG